MTTTTITPTVDRVGGDDTGDDTGDDAGTTPFTSRMAFMAALRAGRYPTVPEPLTVAVAALGRSRELVDEVRRSAPEGLAVFCRRVADDVLAGGDWPAGFADAAYEAEQSAAKLNAQSIAAATIEQQVVDRFAHVVTGALPELLAGLRGELADVMAGLAEADQAIGALDVLDADAVAAATAKQRGGMLKLGELRKRYNGVRVAQRAALQASSVAPPGTTPVSSGHTWNTVFESAVHEFGDIAEYGRPGPHMRQAARFRSLASRPDVWLPDVEELREAWDRLGLSSGNGVTVWPWDRPRTGGQDGTPHERRSTALVRANPRGRGGHARSCRRWRCSPQRGGLRAPGRSAVAVDSAGRAGGTDRTRVGRAGVRCAAGRSAGRRPSRDGDRARPVRAGAAGRGRAGPTE